MWDRLGATSPRVWLALSLGVLVVVVVTDLLTPEVTVAGVAVLAPLLAGLRLPPRVVAGVGAAACLVAVLSLDWASTPGAQQAVRVGIVLAGSILAVLIALARTRMERERLLEGLLEGLIATSARPPAELVRAVARALVPEFADGARVELRPPDGRGPLVGEAGVEVPPGPAPNGRDRGATVRSDASGWTLRGPLRVADRHVGDVGLHRDGHSFGAADLELFDRAADRVALALENSTLLYDSRALTARLGSEHRWLQSVVDQMPSAVTIRDIEGRTLIRNQRAAEIQRQAAGDAPPDAWFDAHPGRHTDGTPVTPEDWPHQRSLRTGETIEGEDFQFERRDGSWAVVRVSSAPIRDERERIAAVVSVFDDTTEQHRDQRALRWLAEVGRLLDHPHTVEARIEEILQMLVAEVADAGLVYLNGPDGSLRLRTLAGGEDVAADPEREVPTGHPAADCVSLQQTLALVRDDEGAAPADAWLRANGFATALLAPISHAQRVHGCIVLATRGHWVHEPRDVETFELIARRIALAVENSQLYAEQHRVATALQRDLLPNELPDWPGLELATLYRPARGAADVGGDFFDLFEAQAERMLVIGDVSGKGVEAAATTALVRHAVRVAARAEHGLRERVATVNQAVLEDAPGDQFCTLAWAALRREDDVVVGDVACAGHPPPLIVRAGGSVEAVAATGTLLGFFKDIRSAGAQLRLGPGDALVLFTDGVTEARLPDGSLFGPERLHAALTRAPTDSADAILDAIERALDDDRAEARDDVAIVVGRVL